MTECNILERRLDFDDATLARDLFGPLNATVERIAEKTGARIETRGASAVVSGDETGAVEQAANALVQLYGLLKNGVPLHPADIDHSLRILAGKPGAGLKELFEDQAFIVSPKKTVRPKSLGQRDYLNALVKNDMVFGVGPAGTGKTYLAVAMAVAALLERRVKRVVLTRPAVEAGEKLGYLPGDLKEKVDPYLRPLYDALNDMLDFRKVREMLDNDVIEIAPLAYMRGRTLNDAFIILDEAQNTTPEQMKMFATRLGFGSKAVVNGDVTQVDLPGRAESGLVQAERILKGVKGVAFVYFNETDVIRHPLVGRIVKAYEQAGGKDKKND